MAKMFTLEAVFAKKGDALILHYGPDDDPSWILIDGGPAGVYKKFLRPRLRQIREEWGFGENEAFPFDMVMVSHIDADHIVGVLDLFKETVEAKEGHQPQPYRIGTLWHNSFDDLLDNKNEEVVSRMAATVASNDPAGLPVPANMSRESRAVVASTGQGRDLRNIAKKLGVEFNKGFEGLVMTQPAVVADVPQKHGLVFSVVGPGEDQVIEYRKRWDKDLKKILKKEEEAANAASFEDSSPFNLASICVLAELEGKTMLLTGDARGDFLRDELDACGMLPLHVDLFKIPHHGSDRNVDEDFFRKVTADHYVFSGDGEHGNPELATLEMLASARGNDDYTIHFTFTEDAHEHEQNHERKTALEKVNTWVKDERPASCTVVFRDPDELSVSVALL